ncbi:DNA polymerase ligase N-terminal domain-containing protein [Bradyrhizobium sp. Rc2d]|uniref:DNA polymerase ligase N-terminal domain-containing protein n=1 Tax=Bradyrhizobium sp. Rc2d TaxID=1855321 RepID=UPI0015A02C01|nr:DNA polymerase ligase N-terminal domain-containing protein [Bradyrhizobium sp. Rc2d]
MAIGSGTKPGNANALALSTAVAPLISNSAKTGRRFALEPTAIDASFRRAGLVQKWDGGTYEAEGAASAAESKQTMRAGLRRGRMSFILKGSKLRGAYSLVRLKSPKQWLLIKTHAKK